MRSPTLAPDGSRNKGRTYLVSFIVIAGIAGAIFAMTKEASPRGSTAEQDAAPSAPFPSAGSSGLTDRAANAADSRSENGHPAAAAAVATPSPVTPAEATRYFLIKRVSVTTDSGILNVPPGTAVEVIEKSTLGYKVRLADGTALDATPDQISTDLRLVNQIVGGERAAYAARAEALRVRGEAEQARHRQQTAAEATPLPNRSTANASSTPPVPQVFSAQFTPLTPRPVTGTMLDRKTTGDGTTMLDEKATDTGTKVNPMRPKKK